MPIKSVDLFGQPVEESSILRMLSGATGYGSHRPMLALALSWFNTRGAGTPRLGTLYEFGMGHGSTPFLMAVAEERRSTYVGFETNEEWFFKFIAKPPEWSASSGGVRGVCCGMVKPGEDHVAFMLADWDAVPLGSMGVRSIDVAFVDHAPGERRHVELARLREKATFVIVHDSEQDGAGDYRLEPVLDTYAYRLDDYPGGAGTTLVSNYVNVSHGPWVDGLRRVREIANALASEEPRV